MVSMIKNLLKPFSIEKSSLEELVSKYLVQTHLQETEKIAQKDKLANLIFDTFYKPFKRYFEFATKNHSVAEELTQDTMFKIYRSLETYSPDKAQFKTWAWTIAKNHFRDYLRSTARKEDGALLLNNNSQNLDNNPWDESHSLDFTTELLQDNELDKLIKQENNKNIAKAINLLSEKNREVLVSWLESDLSMDELAKIHQISVQQVKNHLFQSKKKLKEILKESKHENS